MRDTRREKEYSDRESKGGMIVFFTDAATGGICRLSRHGALPNATPPAPPKAGRSPRAGEPARQTPTTPALNANAPPTPSPDRKSTRLNSSHANTSYAVFCLHNTKTPTVTVLTPVTTVTLPPVTVL